MTSRLLEALKEIAGCRLFDNTTARRMVVLASEAIEEYGEGEPMYTEAQMREAFDAGYANADDSYPGIGFEEFIATIRSKS